MSNSTIKLLVDTNAFVHLADLKDLPWRVLFPEAQRVELLVAPIVIEELDGLKTHTNGRKRDRARQALKQIEEASRAVGYALTLRTEPINVAILILDGPRVDWSGLPRLDQSRPDDRLVAEAITYGHGAAIFSHDTGPRIRARLVGVTAFEPLEAWFLPDERTHEQKRIAQLERDLATARNTRPNVRAGFGTPDSTVSEISFLVPVLAPWHSDAVARMASAFISLHPKAQVSSFRLPRSVALLTNDLSDYHAERYNREYEEFHRSVHNYFVKLHETIEQAAYAQPIEYFVENDSNVTALGLRIEFSLGEGAYLAADEKDARLTVGHSSPPVAPKPQHRDLGVASWQRLALHSLHRQEPHDPTGFTWLDRPEYGAKGAALQCNDFRATRVWEDTIYLVADEVLPLTVDLELSVSATNLAAPINVCASVLVEKRELAWNDAHTLALLPEPVRRIVEEFAKS